MEEERERYFYIAQILSETDRTHEMVDFVKKAIDINPVLTTKERSVLSAAYKNLISNSRRGLRELASNELDEENISEECKNNVLLIKSQISKELISYCEEIIDIIDKKLILANEDFDSQVFYTKMKGDYYRYIAEVQVADYERDDTIIKCSECYSLALKISKEHLDQFTPTALGLVLNYTVFLFEILQKKDEAIEMASETYKTCSPLIDHNAKEARDEAETIVKLLDDNVKIWLSS